MLIQPSIKSAIPWYDRGALSDTATDVNSVNSSTWTELLPLYTAPANKITIVNTLIVRWPISLFNAAFSANLAINDGTTPTTADLDFIRHTFPINAAGEWGVFENMLNGMVLNGGDTLKVWGKVVVSNTVFYNPSLLVTSFDA